MVYFNDNYKLKKILEKYSYVLCENSKHTLKFDVFFAKLQSKYGYLSMKYTAVNELCRRR